jgi:hypothetical protein
MVKKIKVVDVSHNQEVSQQIENIAPEIEEVKNDEIPVETSLIQEDKHTQDEISLNQELKQNEIKPVEQKEKKTKSDKTITCEFCNKEMLMKTYKYTHKLSCQTKNGPKVPPPPPTPPPPPPSIPEPKKRVQRQPPKPKEKKEVIPAIAEKPTVSGIVSFNPYDALRQERILMQQKRIKSLISQAL